MTPSEPPTAAALADELRALGEVRWDPLPPDAVEWMIRAYPELWAAELAREVPDDAL